MCMCVCMCKCVRVCVCVCVYSRTVVHAQDGAVAHVPPADGLLSPVIAVIEQPALVDDVAAVLLHRRVCAEPLAFVGVRVEVRVRVMGDG